MHLGYALIARGAEICEGKLFVLAGDLDTIQTDVLPALLSPLSLACKFVFTPEDRLVSHSFRVEVSNPAGVRNEVLAEVPLKIGYESHPERAAGASVVMHMGLSFESAGEHRFHLMVDSVEVVSLPLYVELLESRNNRNEI